MSGGFPQTLRAEKRFHRKEKNGESVVVAKAVKRADVYRTLHVQSSSEVDLL